MVVPWSFVILPEFVDLDVAGGDDEDVAAEDAEKENSANFCKTREPAFALELTLKDVCMADWSGVPCPGSHRLVKRFRNILFFQIL